MKGREPMDGTTVAIEGDRARQAMRLMASFAERTGLTSDRPQRRYLWTDAFAVCTFLGIARASAEERYAELALGLVDRVHRTLGRHRPDDPRTGWISGLAEEEGASHPTRAGLRIGKMLPERGEWERFDEELEWDRDGQYFHYLTQWMHALDQVSRRTGEPRFNRWARELAEAAFAGFTYERHGRLRMVWKMSTDLSRPLVASMGHHDPLEGFVLCAQLRATAAELGDTTGPALTKELSGFAAMSESGDWATADPLGLGGLLMLACRIVQVTSSDLPKDSLLVSLLGGALLGLGRYVQEGDLRRSPSHRLGFRELGLSIGLRALEVATMRTGGFPASPEVEALLREMASHSVYGEEIEAFWLEPRHQEARTWLEHQDINEVMLATSLLPEGYALLESVCRT